MSIAGKHSKPCDRPAPTGGRRCPGCGGFTHNPGHIIVRNPKIAGSLRGVRRER